MILLSDVASQRPGIVKAAATAAEAEERRKATGS
jgi:hypothetical protein